MTTTAELLLDGFERVRDVVHRVLDGLTLDQLRYRAGPDANTIAWLVWHLTRIQDDHVADVASAEQVWTAGGWYDRFDLPFDASATGWGQTSADVGAVRVTADDLLAYYDAVHEKTTTFVAGITDDDLDRVVDTRWDPPVTLAVRLVSVINDDAQHAGQAAFVRGLLPAR
jgi:uncharacterized damage-inducible protein DinB